MAMMARFAAALLVYWIAHSAVAGGIAAGAATRVPCRIEVVEKATGWPVPLVQLRTTSRLVFVTDNAGVVAIDQPDLLNREVFFHVRGHGYEVPKDGFGFRGVRVTPKLGTTIVVNVTRTIIAKRLGRLTGSGLFAHSQQLGSHLDRKDSSIVGCDSVQVAKHRGKVYWLWGDTTLANYPLGNFHMTAATTNGSPIARFQPPIRPSFQYFLSKRGAPAGVANMPGSGPTWLTGLVSLPDRRGRQRLVASYQKIKPPLTMYEAGLCVWNDLTNRFDHLRTIWKQSAKEPREPTIPTGHPIEWTDGNGKAWIMFGDPFPTLRCAPTFEAWQDPAQWIVLQPSKSLKGADDGKPVHWHRGSIAWHPWRKRWVAIFTQKFGKPSAFGEIWYAQAKSPTGPWGAAVKVLSHDNYTFYNPRIHPTWKQAPSPALLFEGTYTLQFADRPQPTPRYDYNQILYRLDLDDPRLRPATVK